jgi:hypothetical protein
LLEKLHSLMQSSHSVIAVCKAENYGSKSLTSCGVGQAQSSLGFLVRLTISILAPDGRFGIQHDAGWL